MCKMSTDNNSKGILLIIAAMTLFAMQDSLIKFIFEKSALYEIFFGRYFNSVLKKYFASRKSFDGGPDLLSEVEEQLEKIEQVGPIVAQQVATYFQSKKNQTLVDAMQKVNTDGVEPLANPLDAQQRLRADVVTANNQREAFMAIAPKSEAGLFLVPKVIE